MSVEGDIRSSTVVSGYSPEALSVGRWDNTGSEMQNDAITYTRCNPLGITIYIPAKRYVICHLKAWSLLMIVALIKKSLIRILGRKYCLYYVSV